MKKGQHTKGKWEYFPEHSLVGVQNSKTWQADNGFRTVCEVKFGDFEYENENELKANIAMITNSQTNLQALMDIHEHCCKLTKGRILPIITGGDLAKIREICAERINNTLVLTPNQPQNELCQRAR